MSTSAGKAAAAAFPADVDMRHLHFLATSVSVWGEYAARAADAPEELRVTYGYSKDQRPDLKQFLVQMLCCQRNIPLLGGCADGNASDKTINNAVLTRLSAYMARHGLSEGAFVLSYTHLRAHETRHELVCRLLL